MALLTNGLVGLRHDPRLLKLPSYLSLACIVVGIAWLLILPLDEYARKNYISENALLPAHVSTYFGGSEHNVFRAYRHEIGQLRDKSQPEVVQELGTIFKSQGLKVGQQKYHYNTGGQQIEGENVYAILQGPRADATEAIVLMAAWKNMDKILNHSGVALLLSLARYFKRWSLWSKDIIFVITPDSIAGPQAWVDAYHSAHSSLEVEDLPIKGGALQGAIALDYTAGTGGHRFDEIHLIYDGVNGQLPNLDLFNTVVHIAGKMGIKCTLQGMNGQTDGYKDRLETIFRGMLTQGIGQASGPHSSFMSYHVDAITLQTVGDGWHDEVSLGKVVESSVRSLNNLLEHLHQSFFFYLLMHSERFVSIGTYLPAAMLIAVNFSISSIMLWLLSGRRAPPKTASLDSADKKTENNGVELLDHEGSITVVPAQMVETSERQLLIPLVFLLIAHALGAVPMYLLNNSNDSSILVSILIITLLSNSGPFVAASALRTITLHPFQAATLLSCFSLLTLGITLATLSTLNFSLGFFIGLLASPLSFVSVFIFPTGLREGRRSTAQDSESKIGPTFFILVLSLFSPMAVIGVAILYVKQYTQAASVLDTLMTLLASQRQAWHVSGTWTSLVIWLVWWPAWFVGMTVGICGLLGFNDAGEEHTPDSASIASSSTAVVNTKKASAMSPRAKADGRKVRKR